MKSSLGAAILVFVSLADATGASAGQIDRLKAGMLQCYDPNIVQHTCAALSGYTFNGNSITNQAEVLISQAPVGTMKTNSPVTISGDVVCGHVSKRDMDAAIITVDGKIQRGDQANQIKAQIWTSLAPRAGKEICTTYLPSKGGSYVARYTIDGKEDATPPTKVILVGSKDGYKVAP